MELILLRVIVIVLGLLMIVFNRPIGRTTAAWQETFGLGPLVSETNNRVTFILMGLFLVIIALFK
jgi:hypothetical protein